MTLHETLRTLLAHAALDLTVPIFWHGEVFAPPMGPHLVARIEIQSAMAASLGPEGLTRTDGALVVECVTVSGKGDAEAVDLSRRLSAKFPRGLSRELSGSEPGEMTLGTPVAQPAQSDGRRITVPLRIPFYALTQPQKEV